MRTLIQLLLALAVSGIPQAASAMCGGMFPIEPPRRPGDQTHVAKKVLNRASKVALVREGDRTVITMANDVQTDADELGLVIPVPTVIRKEDVRVVDPGVFTSLETITNPRIIEKYDADPCPDENVAVAAAEAAPPSADGVAVKRAQPRAADYGVKVEAHYHVGEYSIAVLSAKQGAGSGLMQWLNKFHYNVPEEAVPVLNSYIKQNMQFFVAKVNFKEKKKLGFTYLRPIQVRYDTPKFILPVRLGTINADGPQELVVYALSAKGRIEPVNYRGVRMPTGQDLPLYVKDRFDQVYEAAFDAQTKAQDMRVVFTEFVQRGGVDPATHEKLGLAWGGRNPRETNFGHYTTTRLHFRYDRERFPEDLVLQETFDVEPFSVSYSVHHPARNVSCEEGAKYLAALPARREQEAQALANLTGWDLPGIREKVGLPAGGAAPAPSPAPTAAKKWWQHLWGN